MIELDSPEQEQEQEQELNCKIIVGKVGIFNVDDFLAVLKTIARNK